jgi:hypothetical protein
MARPTRTINDLIGKQVVVPEQYLIPRASHHRYAWFVLKRCKVVDVLLDSEGVLSALYVVKGHEFRWEGGRRRVVTWRKTRVRLSRDLWDLPTQRYRGDGDSVFRWRVCKRMNERVELHSHAVTMARGQRGTSTKEWMHTGPTIAWWLNNPFLIEQVVWPRKTYGT